MKGLICKYPTPYSRKNSDSSKYNIPYNRVQGLNSKPIKGYNDKMILENTKHRLDKRVRSNSPKEIETNNKHEDIRKNEHKHRSPIKKNNWFEFNGFKCETHPALQQMTNSNSGSPKRGRKSPQPSNVKQIGVIIQELNEELWEASESGNTGKINKLLMP